MTVGLPGAGIGGLFYLIAGLLMPVREAWLTVTGRSSRARWRVVLHQFSIASGIAGGTWASSWLLTTLLLRIAHVDAPRSGDSTGLGTSLHRTAEWLRPTHGLVQFATLVVVVAGTWALGTLMGERAIATTPSTAPATAASPAVHAGDAGVSPAAVLVRMPTPRRAHDLRIPTPMPTPWRQRRTRPDEV